MAKKLKNPLAQALGLVLQDMRNKTGISSAQIASMLGLAASHYRMIEAGSAILQPSRAMRVTQTFADIHFVPLCQVLVSIQVLDSLRQSVTQMRAAAQLLTELDTGLGFLATKLGPVWQSMEHDGQAGVAAAIASSGFKDELTQFLATEPPALTASQIDNFMSPTYRQPLSGKLYSKIGNILQGVAPFYLDTVLQLIDNLRNVTPRVTAEELARWENLHKNRFSHVIGIIRNPEIVLDVSAFDYSYLWEESFNAVVVIHRDRESPRSTPVHRRLADILRARLESEHARYERRLQTFDDVIARKFRFHYAGGRGSEIDQILSYRGVPMNNLWAYIMLNGYVVPFIDDATVEHSAAGVYGTSLGYDETSDKIARVRKLCSDIGLSL